MSPTSFRLERRQTLPLANLHAVARDCAGWAGC